VGPEPVWTFRRQTYLASYHPDHSLVIVPSMLLWLKFTATHLANINLGGISLLYIFSFSQCYRGMAS